MGSFWIEFAHNHPVIFSLFCEALWLVLKKSCMLILYVFM